MQIGRAAAGHDKKDKNLINILEATLYPAHYPAFVDGAVKSEPDKNAMKEAA